MSPDCQQLKEENKQLKQKIKFYEEIFDKMNVMLHIDKIVDKNKAEVYWANRKYKTFIENEIKADTRTNNSLYKVIMHVNDTNSIYNQRSNKQKTDNIIIYKCITKTDKEKWLAGIFAPFKQTKDGTIKEMIIATVELNENIFNTERYNEMIKELNYLRCKVELDKLTKTEKEILKLMVNGLSEKDIARQKNRSLHTIKTHIRNIKHKLNIKKNTELVKFALKSGLV